MGAADRTVRAGRANRCCARCSTRSRRCVPRRRSAADLGVSELLRFLRFAVQPVRRAGEELFAGEGAAMLLAGNALHTDLPPEAAAGAMYGWLLAMLGQTVGFPVPVGGSSGADRRAGRAPSRRRRHRAAEHARCARSRCGRPGLRGAHRRRRRIETDHGDRGRQRAGALRAPDRRAAPAAAAARRHPRGSSGTRRR